MVARDLLPVRLFRTLLRRPRMVVAQSARAALAHAKANGVVETLRWLRQHSAEARAPDRYAEWVAAHTPDAAALQVMRRTSETWNSRPRFSILTPVFNTDPAWLRACIASVRAQAYTNWELILSDDASTKEETRTTLRELSGDGPQIRVVWNPRNLGIAGASQAALEQASGDYVALLDHDDELLPHALFRVAEHIRRWPDRDLIYSDEDKLEPDGRRSDVYFKPDWSPDLFLSSMYICHLLVIRRSVVNDAGGFRPGFDGSQDHDLALRVLERTSRVHHVADVLYHWRKIPASVATSGTAKPWAHLAGVRALQEAVARRGLQAAVEDAGSPGLYRVRYALTRRPLVSVIVPRARAIEATSYAPFEVVVAPARATESESLDAAAAEARGDFLFYLGTEVVPQHPDWIEPLLEHVQRREVGAAGGKVLSADGRVRHVGLTRGDDGRARRLFLDFPGSWPGYFSNTRCVRNCLAVSRSALLVRRDALAEAGGWRGPYTGDELDLDLGARLHETGRTVIFTPYARFEDRGPLPSSRSHSLPQTSPAQGQGRDPYYNPHLSTDPAAYLVREC